MILKLDLIKRDSRAYVVVFDNAAALVWSPPGISEDKHLEAILRWKETVDNYTPIKLIIKGDVAMVDRQQIKILDRYEV